MSNKVETVEEKLKRLKQENPLSPQISDEYELKGLIPGEIGWKGLRYDLRTISKSNAEKLISEGFKNLVKKSKAGSK